MQPLVDKLVSSVVIPDREMPKFHVVQKVGFVILTFLPLYDSNFGMGPSLLLVQMQSHDDKMVSSVVIPVREMPEF